MDLRHSPRFEHIVIFFANHIKFHVCKLMGGDRGIPRLGIRPRWKHISIPSANIMNLICLTL